MRHFSLAMAVALVLGAVVGMLAISTMTACTASSSEGRDAGGDSDGGEPADGEIAIAGDARGNNRPPKLAPMGAVEVSEGQRVTLDPQAVDPDGDPLAFTFSGWMTTSTRIATHADVGQQTVTVTVHDGQGGTDSLDISIAVVQDDNPNEATFALEPSSPWDVPFPSNAFTVADNDMVTGLRVQLPRQTNDSLMSELKDIEAVNLLDGFSMFPRITVPFTGAMPDAPAFTGSNIYLVALSSPHRGRVIPIDQRIVDDSRTGSPRLIFAADGFLRESSRYVLVVTRGLTAGSQPIRRADALTALLWRYESGELPAAEYQAQLFDALDAIISERSLVRLDDVLTLSVFTTRTATDVAIKLHDRLVAKGFTIEAPQFDVDDRPGDEVFDTSDLDAIVSYVHRATRFAGSSSFVSFPPGSLIDQTGAHDLKGAEIYIRNIRNGAGMRVPARNISSDGSVQLTNISSLVPRSGDELALLVKRVLQYPGNLPFRWNSSVQKVAFGTFPAPQYYDGATGRLPVVKTKPGFIPSQTGVESIAFSLIVPAGTRPPGGWPVVVFLHGGTGFFLDGTILHTAAVLADRGLATVAFNALDHGGGVHSTVEVSAAGRVHSIPGTGRALDKDHDNRYGIVDTFEYHQRMSDVGALLRSIQAGADFDGDGTPDLTQDPMQSYVLGTSYGGATTTMLAAFETAASRFCANVPSGYGSRFRWIGYYPYMGPRTPWEEALSARTPPIGNNGSSPEWGGTFDEDIPVKGKAVQVGLVAGAEQIQRMFDFLGWKELAQMPSSYAARVSSGELRTGGPAEYFLQIGHGDWMTVSGSQVFLVRAGSLEPRTTAILFNNEPRFDAQYEPSLPGWMSRHVVLGIPYSGRPATDVGGHLSHLVRIQVAAFFTSGVLSDPDGQGTIFAGDVFQVPIPAALLDEMLVDPGYPWN